MKNISFLTDKQKKFLQFCINQHSDQKRKYTGEPYWYHLINVAKILFDAGHRNLIEIALGHDLLEDVPNLESKTITRKLASLKYSHNSIIFIEGGILALTDVFTKEAYPELNRKTRKEKEARRLGRIFPDFQTVKYADLIDNSRDILENDPKFAKIYIAEKVQILEFMDKGSSKLYNQAKKIIK